MNRLVLFSLVFCISGAVQSYQPVAPVYPPPWVRPVFPLQPMVPRYLPPPRYPSPWQPHGWVQPVKPIRVHPGKPAGLTAGDQIEPEPELSKLPVETPLPAAPESAELSPRLDEKKQAFVDRLTPIVQQENDRLRMLRRELERLYSELLREQLDGAGTDRLRQLARRYRVEGNVLKDPAARRDLLDRVDIIPLELALAQAVNESAWGTSRFAREGNNLFGIWTYDQDKGIVPKNRAKGAKHLVRRFDSLDESVRYYLHTLNSHPAYAELRRIRAESRSQGKIADGLLLAGGLTRYSAKGEHYVALIRQLIRRYPFASAETSRRPQA